MYAKKLKTHRINTQIIRPTPASTKTIQHVIDIFRSIVKKVILNV